MRRLGERVVDGLRQPPEFDPLADDLAKALRREKLRADVRRLERILATDESMSACRQLGNRIAYDWLSVSWTRAPATSPDAFAGHDFADSWVDNWNVPEPATVTRDFARSQYAPARPAGRDPRDRLETLTQTAPNASDLATPHFSAPADLNRWGVSRKCGA